MNSQLSWRPAPRSLTLPENEVHVWRVALELDTGELKRIQSTLSSDERVRVARLLFPKDQQRFVAARGFLRTILARYLDREPARIDFRYGPFGKPELAPVCAADGLRFNVSHCEGLALCVITRHHEIGVDIERVRGDFAWEEIAERFFAPREVEALRSVPAALQYQAFFNCWTRKEAFVKARGEGLALGFDQFEVSLVPGDRVRLLRRAGDPEEASRWSIHEVEPASGYVAAVAVRAQGCRLPTRLSLTGRPNLQTLCFSANLLFLG